MQFSSVKPNNKKDQNGVKGGKKEDKGKCLGGKRNFF